MCKAKSPPPPLPAPPPPKIKPPRAPERQPKRGPIGERTRQRIAGAGSGRATLINADGVIRRAPTAQLGGASVVLGG